MAMCLRFPIHLWRKLLMKVCRIEGVAEHGSKKEGSSQTR